MLVTYLEASRDLCETDSILFGAALAVCRIIGAKLSTTGRTTGQSSAIPAWRTRIEERIAKARALIGRLICFRSGNTRPRIVRTVRMAFAGTNVSLSQPDIMQKLTERIDDLKQRIAAWGKRIRRYTERSTRFNQNRLFQSDQKRLYKSLERPMVSGTGPVPNQADTVAFWRSLWSEPVNHNEGPWTEVVASQCAGITPMDPVTITPDDVAEAVRRAPNWKSPGLDGLHHYWLKGFVVCHTVLARQFQEVLNQKSLPSLFTTGITHLVPKGQSSTRYMSATIQNEMIESLGTKLETHLLEQIRALPFFASIMDMTQDISKIDQLRIVVSVMNDIKHAFKTLQKCDINLGGASKALAETKTKLQIYGNDFELFKCKASETAIKYAQLSLILARPAEMTILSKVIDFKQMQNITTDFNRLGDRCYLDHAGAALYPQSLLQHVHDDLLNNVYMNPHTDRYTKDCIEQIRCLVLNHFHTDPSKYSVVFTSGATQSLKLTVEAFDFASNTNDGLDCGSFVYLNENHTSVLGLREIAGDKNVDIINISHENFLKSIKHTETTTKPTVKDKTDGNILLAYPALSNFNGFKYPIDCIQNIKNGCLNRYLMKHLCKVNCNWYVLLDAASFVPSNNLDLSQTQPDFVCLSFYKIFGYPTGLGALLIKNASGDVLCRKRYFGGGTVDIVLSNENFHVKRKILHERLEDGSLPFLSILALKHCFDTLHRLIPKTINNDIMDTIAYHTYNLAKDLYNQLKELHHPNGNKAAILYMDSDFLDIKTQGGIVTFNLLRDDGSYIGYMEFQNMADLFNINVRTGCFCNSGSCQRHLNVANRELKEMYKAGHTCGDETDLIKGKPTGAIRISFGYYNTFNDVDKLILMICRCFVRTNFKIPKRLMTYPTQFTAASKSINKSYEDEMLNLSSDRVYLNTNYLSSEVTDEGNNIVLDEIAIYPVKSCGAFKIRTAWKIGSKGFEFDREWMIVRENGICLTQKQSTEMCMIHPEIDLKHKLLTLNFKGMPSISISLNQVTENVNSHGSLCNSKVCMDVVKGHDCGDEVADWVSNALGISYLRLIRQSNTENRIQKKNIEANIENLTDRFRGNLIIDMEDELVEKEWQRVIIGSHEFKVEGTCQRCQMVCIDQQTGEKTAEPLRTISEQFAGKMRFGIYLSYIDPVNGAKDKLLKVKSQVKPVINDDNISR
ncbi:unnamed protein product [Parnassius apollo]|uniref:Molybdenum cofactor sulfurase n=1 Tax=Parnassius apollo TaxID=110799 RepID=A0A8S3X261_PARAO|nr:unnamed protein product [Parnassius apollo]